MREKLRLRLTKRKEEQPKKEDLLLDQDEVEDHRKVEDLLQFINSADNKPVSSSKAAKRARHKQKKVNSFCNQELCSCLNLIIIKLYLNAIQLSF